jgi:hypothetical protein
VSISAIQWVLENSQSAHGARLVALAIADEIREDRIAHGAWPSVTTLMRKTNLRERAVHSAIAELEKLGEIQVARNAGPKGCNVYHLTANVTPAKSAPLQNLHPAESAPPQNLQGSEFPQADGPLGADNAPGADFAGVQKTTARGAESAPEPVREPVTKNSSRPKRDLNADREDVERLCVHLANRLQDHDPDGLRPTYGKQWRDSARLMLDSDHRKEDRLHKAIDWCQDDEFWRTVVRSMPKLRKHYPVLQQKAAEERRKRAGSNGSASSEHASPRDEHMYRR